MGRTMEENGEKASKIAPEDWHCRDKKLEQSRDTSCKNKDSLMDLLPFIY
jgi:hypothetical protein